VGRSKSSYCQVEGRYIKPLQASKQKPKQTSKQKSKRKKHRTKGVILDCQGRELEVYFPKKLRVLLDVELQPGDNLRVLAEEKKGKIIAINVMKTAIEAADRVTNSAPLRLATVPDLLVAHDRERARSAKPSQVVKICRKGTCRKRGSLDLLKQWQGEADREPQLAGVECQLTGCLKQCKKGVNVQVDGRVVNHAQESSLAEIAGKAARHA